MAYVAFTDTTIWGYGDTPEAARQMVIEAIGEPGQPVNENWPEPERSINRLFEELEIAEATPALAHEVEERGGAISWGMLPDGRACTDEEAED